MNKQFIPYYPALKLKELGFDEECFGYYNEKYQDYVFVGKVNSSETDFNPQKTEWACLAPLWQQAFRWFSENKNLFLHYADEYKYDGEQYWRLYILHKYPLKKGEMVSECVYSYTKTDYKTQEDAMEKLILEAIELISK